MLISFSNIVPDIKVGISEIEKKLYRNIFISGIKDGISDDVIPTETFPGYQIRDELNELDDEVDDMTDTFNKACEKLKKENKIEFEDTEDAKKAKVAQNLGSEGSNGEDDDKDSPLFAKYNAIPTTPNAHQVPPSPLKRLGRTLGLISEIFFS